jgi:tetratricopeptide (TPR) repeat protein
MFKRNIDLRKKIYTGRLHQKNPPAKEIRINLKINLGKRPWRIYISIIMVIIAALLASYLLYFRGRMRELNYQQGLDNLSKGKFDEASKNFENASAGKNEADVLYKLAVSKYNQKDFQGAIDAYQKALQKKPDNAPVFNGLANLYRDQKNFPLATEYYQKAVGADSSYVVSYSNWSIMLFDEGKLDEAKKIVDTGLEKNSGNAELENLRKMLVN